jgi:FAD/FMN-containing dehydrogenase
MLDWKVLDGTIAGEVILPESREYELARRPALARFADTRPQAIARCRTPEDVAEALAFARDAGLRAVPRCGGHCFAGRSSTDGIVVDVSPMRSVSVGHGVVTVGGGARLGDLYDALDEHVLTIPGGCGPEVGIAGLTLGGGLGILGRRHGLTSDHLLGARVVLADGRVVDCDLEHHDDLFWALRGAGGGQFGVVTSFVFGTLRAPDAASFHLVWAQDHVAAVLAAWLDWAPDAPDELAASLLVSASPDVEEPPVATVVGAMVGTAADAAEELAELVGAVGAQPLSASCTAQSYRATKRYLAGLGDGEDPFATRHVFSRSEFHRGTLPADAIEALVEHLAAERVAGQARELDFTPWGGAYNRTPPDATAFVHRAERFLLKHGVSVEASATAGELDGARAWLGRSFELTRPFGAGGVYPNFPDPELEDWAEAYWGENLDRLLRVKRAYDPEGFFRFDQALGAPA